MTKLNVKVFGFNVSAEISKGKTKDEMSRDIAESVRMVVIEQMRKESRQGGLLYKGRGNL